MKLYSRYLQKAMMAPKLKHPYATFIIILAVFNIFVLTYMIYNTKICLPNLMINRDINKGGITVQSSGRLGNQIFEYLSLYVLWSNNRELFTLRNLEPYIEPDMKKSLLGLFQNVLINSTKENKHVKKIVDHTEKLTFDSLGSDWYQLVEYSARYEEILQYGIPQLLNHLKFRDDVLKTIEPLVKKMTSNNKTLICAHYRGGDYVNHLKRTYKKSIRLSSYKYYQRAIEYFKSKNIESNFVLLTADKQWLKSNKDKICSEKDNIFCNPIELPNNPYNHFAFLSHCNSSIINYGTFGVLSALFAGGETIVYDLKKPLTHRGHNLAMAIASYLPKYKWFLGDEDYLECDYFNGTKTCEVYEELGFS